MAATDFTRLVLDARYVRVGAHDGISRYITGLSHGLAAIADSRPDLEVRLMVSDPRQLDKLPQWPWFLGPDPVSVKEVVTGQVLNRQRPDVVFSPMQTMGALRRRFGLILTLHDLIYYDHPTPPADLPAPVRAGWRLFHKSVLPQQLALNRADAVATVSETSARLIRERRLTKRPVHVVPNAADAAEVLSIEMARQRFQERSQSAERNLLYMGSFMPYKDVETLLRMAALLPDHTLHLASRITPERRRQLSALAPSARVIFHDGVDDPTYRRLLGEATALVHASRAEGYGLPLMEALSAGTPVVCSDTEIFREVAGDAARYVQVGDAPGFAAAVRELEDPNVSWGMIQRGLVVARRSSWEASARELLAAVDAVRHHRLRAQK
ncbi:glycosyltransferase family 4 protein [Kocuria sp.]|uniref:glycosyltransferase family 4 protein n=1 Tax=Kocuria sp. TaxID=1871328 RepID=UPI0026DF40A5|nr:glycosyltransferase family 1 protein [Kocuria sp.]MDO5617675.1 glycosyltransferase family 1 protein [Kocuria sp.]